MRIAIFDYSVAPTNPSGGLNRLVIEALCGEHEFTVFSVTLANPCPERVRWVRIRVPTRPLALLFICYHVAAPIQYTLHRLRTRTRFDLIQVVESNLVMGDISWAHFCHSAYLRTAWCRSRPTGVRRLSRWLDHRLHALMERPLYRRVRHVVTVSNGLRSELCDHYPAVRSKVSVIANPVDLTRMQRPDDFDRQAVRRRLGLTSSDVVLVFIALGHYERKGLPLAIGALEKLGESKVRLVVIGGSDADVRHARHAVDERGLTEQVRFAGMQDDVRPFLWAADAFILPSSYEAWPLAALEAAAAGLPLLATRLYGVEDLLRDGHNGFLMDRTVEGVVDAVVRLLALGAHSRSAMGEQARRDASVYDVDCFIERWRDLYDELGADSPVTRRTC